MQSKFSKSQLYIQFLYGSFGCELTVENFFKEGKKDKALTALKRRKMQSKFIENTDQQAMGLN